MIPSHLPIETDMNDKLTPYVFNGNLDDYGENYSDKNELPGEYKIVETIYDNDDEDQLDLK